MADYRENVVSNILSFTKEDGNSSLDSLDILIAVDHHRLFGIQNASGLQEEIGHIHSCLNTAANRHDGLLLLEKVVSQSSTDVFTKNVHTWFNLLIQVLQSHGDIPEKQLACRIVGEMMITSSCFPELSRELSSSVIPKLIPSLLTATSAWQEAATQCIKSCVENFPGPCRSFRAKIEAVLLRELDRPCPHSASIECFAEVSRLGGGPNQGGKQVDGWTDRCQSLLQTLHGTLGCLYEGVETDNTSTPEVGLFTTTPDTEPERSSVLTARYKTLTACLQALLSVKYTSSVKVPGQDIVRLVCRCLAINYRMLLARPTTDRIRLFSRLPELHCASLDLLTALIISCRTELLPLSDLINKLYIQTLVCSHMDSVYGQDRPLSTVRMATYGSMRKWLQTVGNSSNLVTEEKDLVKEILHDVTPITDKLRLSSTNKTGLDPPPAKKKRKSGYQELSGGISSYRKTNHMANSHVTVGALQVLHLLVSSFGDTLKNKSYQDIMDSLISTVLEVQQNVLEAPAPYRNAECRQGLYRVLLSCSLNAHPKVSSPLQVNLGLFRAGLQDSNVEVSYCCREALMICECLVHPRAPCLRGPRLDQGTVTVRSVTTEKDQNANKITVNDNHVASVNNCNASTNTDSGIDETCVHREQRTDAVTSKSCSSVNTDSSKVKIALASKDDSLNSRIESNKSLQSNIGTEKISDNSKESNKVTEESSDEESSDAEMEEEVEVRKRESEEEDKSESQKMVDQELVQKTKDLRSAVSRDVTSLFQITGKESVQPSTSRESDRAEKGQKAPETKNTEVDAMLLSFVDAGPDSD